MTSTSELFHYNRRRYRFNFNGGDVTDSCLAAEQPRRTTTIRRSQYHNNRCPPSSRPTQHHHPATTFHLEHDEQVGNSSQSSSGNSSDIRGRGSESDRLPGAVLLARERLLERLRGVSVSGNRQSSRSSSNINQYDISSNRNSSFIQSDHPLQIRNQRIEEILTRKHPPGLTRDALNILQSEVFISKNDDETSNAIIECTICLEDIQEGSDKVIRLRCAHTFHSSCLVPWVRICGACPNCRKHVHGMMEMYSQIDS